VNLRSTQSVNLNHRPAHSGISAIKIFEVLIKTLNEI
jgi:hypothetical protein